MSRAAERWVRPAPTREPAGGGVVGEAGRLWHVCVTVGGIEVEPLIVRNALRRLSDQRPFLHSMRFGANRAEIRYWEEASSVLDASSLALRVWDEHRESAGLPRWEVVALEVLEREVFLSRGMVNNLVSDLHEVTPQPF